MVTYRTRVLVVAVVGLVAAAVGALGPPTPAGAQGDGEAHFHGGQVIVDEGTIIVNIEECPEGTEPDGSVLFPLEVEGEVAFGTFHCSDIDATGPLGDALVDLLCDVAWEWPVGTGTHLSLSCLVHIFLETILGDFLCDAHASLLTTDSDEGHWYIANASPGFGNVAATGTCPALIAAAIDDFIDSGVEVLLAFLFSDPPPPETGHFDGGALVVDDGGVVFDLSGCLDEFVIAVAGGGASGEMHCTGVVDQGAPGVLELSLLCEVDWDEWPVGPDTHLGLGCDLHIDVDGILLCLATATWLAPGEVGNDPQGGIWHVDPAAGGIGNFAATGSCPAFVAGVLDGFVDAGTTFLASIDL